MNIQEICPVCEQTRYCLQKYKVTTYSGSILTVLECHGCGKIFHTEKQKDEKQWIHRLHTVVFTHKTYFHKTIDVCTTPIIRLHTVYF